jgi:hypothetical protein
LNKPENELSKLFLGFNAEMLVCNAKWNARLNEYGRNHDKLEMLMP